MEELTIGEKTYISSKRAAEITGYAKDYVGQLCREGRVEATLVGRSWYVLESSIRAHRFGSEGQDSLNEPKVEEWSPSVYMAENAQPFPPLAPNAPKRSINILETSPATPPEVLVQPTETIADMQSAWKEWFSTRDVQPVEESTEPAVQVSISETKPAEIDSPELRPEKLLEEYDPVPFTAIKEEPVAVQRHQEVRRPVAPQQPQNVIRKRVRRKKGKTYLAMKALFAAVIILSVVVALIGTGLVDTSLGKKDPGFNVIRLIGGAELIERSK